MRDGSDWLQANDVTLHKSFTVVGYRLANRLAVSIHFTMLSAWYKLHELRPKMRVVPLSHPLALHRKVLVHDLIDAERM